MGKKRKIRELEAKVESLKKLLILADNYLELALDNPHGGVVLMLKRKKAELKAIREQERRQQEEVWASNRYLGSGIAKWDLRDGGSDPDKAVEDRKNKLIFQQFAELADKQRLEEFNKHYPLSVDEAFPPCQMGDSSFGGCVWDPKDTEQFLLDHYRVKEKDGTLTKPRPLNWSWVDHERGLITPMSALPNELRWKMLSKYPAPATPTLSVKLHYLDEAKNPTTSIIQGLQQEEAQRNTNPGQTPEVRTDTKGFLVQREAQTHQEAGQEETWGAITGGVFS